MKAPSEKRASTDEVRDRETELRAVDELLVPEVLHELRQPLQGIEAAATLLERAAGTELVDTEEWRMLRGQLARLSEIVREYGELLRPGRARGAAFAIEPVVARTVGLLAHRIRPLAERFTFAPAARGQEGYGAPGALVHAATNVLVNALDAIEGVEGSARVGVRVLPALGGGVEVRVSDEGVGIPLEHRGRVFEPRFSTKRRRGGSGLGLHVSRRLMNRYGGEVFLVEQDDPARLAWAVTEFCIAIPPPPREAA